MTHFTQFNLDQNILKALQYNGFDTPTPIQTLAIPKILEGADIIASAQTGTGKTAAFMLPIMHLLTQSGYRGSQGPHVLILVPTRELAIQITAEAKKFSQYLNKVKTVCIYGGVPYPPQKRQLASKYEILVATPGRLIDHMQQGKVDLSSVKMLVLDEADRMLDMGFSSAVEQIANATPKHRQTLMFSATIDGKILPYSKKMQKHPHTINVGIDLATQTNIEQRLYYVDGIKHKIQILERILETTDINQAIIFTSTIRQADNLATHLHEKGFLSSSLHGDMNQRQRSRTIDKFRGGHIRFLIATDVAGRGIDIACLSHVFNFDLPFQAEDFVHRVGRTGRAGAKGTAITFATYADHSKISHINKIIQKPIEVHTIEGLEPKAKEAAKAPTKPRNRFAKFGARRKPQQNPGNREDRKQSFPKKNFKSHAKKPALTSQKTHRV